MHTYVMFNRLYTNSTQSTYVYFFRTYVQRHIRRILVAYSIQCCGFCGTVSTSFAHCIPSFFIRTYILTRKPFSFLVWSSPKQTPPPPQIQCTRALHNSPIINPSFRRIASCFSHPLPCLPSPLPCLSTVGGWSGLPRRTGEEEISGI